MKIYFDHRRSCREVEIARQQEGLIAALIKDGFPPDQAQSVATSLLQNVVNRTTEDPVLKIASGLLGKSG